MHNWKGMLSSEVATSFFHMNRTLAEFCSTQFEYLHNDELLLRGANKTLNSTYMKMQEIHHSLKNRRQLNTCCTCLRGISK